MISEPISTGCPMEISCEVVYGTVAGIGLLLFVIFAVTLLSVIVCFKVYSCGKRRGRDQGYREARQEQMRIERERENPFNEPTDPLLL